MITKIQALQDYLLRLVVYIQSEDLPGFVSAFVPLDLSSDDREAFLKDLQTPPSEATGGENQWLNLSSEIQALSTGGKTKKIEMEKEDGTGDLKVVYYFEHPLLEGCDRECCFILKEGEWRAEA
jgi:hypothetical protein